MELFGDDSSDGLFGEDVRDVQERDNVEYYRSILAERDKAEAQVRKVLRRVTENLQLSEKDYDEIAVHLTKLDDTPGAYVSFHKLCPDILLRDDVRLLEIYGQSSRRTFGDKFGWMVPELVSHGSPILVNFFFLANMSEQCVDSQKITQLAAAFKAMNPRALTERYWSTLTCFMDYQSFFNIRLFLRLSLDTMRPVLFAKLLFPRLKYFCLGLKQTTFYVPDELVTIIIKYLRPLMGDDYFELDEPAEMPDAFFDDMGPGSGTYGPAYASPYTRNDEDDENFSFF